eukprot:m.226001 g.226001  ORF g.226001 m.226001 type:complete len:199 (-) comp16854_c0_seq1:343-939(-)
MADLEDDLLAEEHTGEPEEVTEDAEAAARDPEVDEVKSKIAQIEEETEKLKALQEKQKELDGAHAAHAGPEAREEADNRSIHVGNVDYATKPEDLQTHFAACGTVLRVTILCDKVSGQPKGFAYIEFQDPDSVGLAVTTLDGSTLHNRPLKVSAKRTNVPGFMRGRGRGGRRPFRGGFRGARRPSRPYARNRTFFAPY